MNKLFQFQGEEYGSIKECCEALGVNYGSFKDYRHRTGCTAEEALDGYFPGAEHRPTQKFFYNGQGYPSVKACCEALRISYASVMCYRHDTDCTTAEAIDHILAVVYASRQGFVYNGQHYESINACCRALRIPSSAVFTHRKRTGCTVEDAITHYRLPANLQLLYTGRTTGKIYYSGTCRTCKRKLLLTEDELESFAHSDEFCENHLIPWD